MLHVSASYTVFSRMKVLCFEALEILSQFQARSVKPSIVFQGPLEIGYISLEALNHFQIVVENVFLGRYKLES